MNKRKFFDVTEAIFTIALLLFFIFFNPEKESNIGNILKEGIIYTIIDNVLLGIVYIGLFATFCMVYAFNNKIKKVLTAYGMFALMVTCEVLRLPLLEFPEHIVEQLNKYPYYGIALLVWSSIYIIDYFSKEQNNNNKERE